MISYQININNKQITVGSQMSILQLCEKNDIIIPRFCYHERLSIAGNCRMCLVEIEKFPKLVASCATPIQNGLRIFTNSSIVKKAREGILEFLLLNHPLDCPICDQSGECDLQDQSNIFGSDKGRFQENKRATQDKECSPLIKTIMTRCIHCTRCVRFSNEILGIPYLGTSGRGNNLEISFYVDRFFKSEFSGNLIDLCPVGALTAKPYAFIGKSWELQSVESIDTLDATGCNIKIDTRSYEIIRILPKLNERINEEWISDKSRFAFDSLKRQRFYHPLVKLNKRFEISSWKNVLTIIKQKYLSSNFQRFIGVLGNQTDLETTVISKSIIRRSCGFYIFNDLNIRTHNNDYDLTNHYKFNTTFRNIENCDVCLFLGVNPRIDGAILNLHLRKRYLNKPFIVAYVGSKINLTFPILHLGCSSFTIAQIVEGNHYFSKLISRSKNPLIIFGKSFYNSLNSFLIDQIRSIFVKNVKNILVKKNDSHVWFGFNLLSTEASNYNKCEVGIHEKLNVQKNDDIFLIIGESKFKKTKTSELAVYIGTHGNFFASNSDIILPSCSYVEKKSTFINCEGQIQQTNVATLPPGESREDSNILQAIQEYVFLRSNVFHVKEYVFSLLNNFIPISNSYKKITAFYFLYYSCVSNFTITFLPSSIYNNFYITNKITEFSPTMAKCSTKLLNKSCFI